MIYQTGIMGGYPFVIASTLRKKGIEAINVALETSDNAGITNRQGAKIRSKRNLKYDTALYHKSDNKFTKLIKRLRLVLEIAFKGKLVHYHSEPLLPYYLETYLFKLLKIPMFISWGGGDGRITAMAISDNPYFYRDQEPVRDQEIKNKYRLLAKNGVRVFADPEMELYCTLYFKHIHRFRVPIDLSKLKQFQKVTHNPIPKVLHIPTHPIQRGTVHFESAIKRLKSEGHQFEYIFTSNLSQEEVYAAVSDCDILLDELRTGSHGVLALEACALGKPVFTYIKESIINQFPPELPFVNSNPDTVYDNLKELINNPERRAQIGKQAREYIEKYHDSNVVVEEMLKIYKQAMKKS